MASGLSKKETDDLNAVLKRLRAAYRPGYFGAHERFALLDVTNTIERRLSPPSPAALIAEAEKILGPAEATLYEIDSRPAVMP